MNLANEFLKITQNQSKEMTFIDYDVRYHDYDVHKDDSISRVQMNPNEYKKYDYRMRHQMTILGLTIQSVEKTLQW